MSHSTDFGERVGGLGGKEMGVQWKISCSSSLPVLPHCGQPVSMPPSFHAVSMPPRSWKLGRTSIEDPDFQIHNKISSIIVKDYRFPSDGWSSMKTSHLTLLLSLILLVSVYCHTKAAPHGGLRQIHQSVLNKVEFLPQEYFAVNQVPVHKSSHLTTLVDGPTVLYYIPWR